MKTLTLALGGGAVVAVAVAAAVWLRHLPEGGGPVAVDATPEAQPEAVSVAPEATGQVAVQENVAEAEPAEAGVEDVAPIAPPVRTDFRFEPDGSWLVAGRAAAMVPLAVIVDGTEVERVDVGADGSFVALGVLGFSDSPRVMRLVSDPDGAAVMAEQTLVLAANPAPVIVAEVEAGELAVQPDQPTEDPAQVAVEREDRAAADDEAETGTNTETIAQADVAAQPQVALAQDVASAEDRIETEPAPAAGSPAILAVTPDGVEVVQPPVTADTPPEVMSSVALDTITYDLDGEVVLRGRALGEGFVQVYVDNAPVSRLPVDSDGRWRGDLPDVDKGVYTLRIDEVDAEGTVVSRIETPFLREDPADVVDAMADDVANPEFTVATRTVQPGATLWAIAEERYGAGVLYVNVFEANRDRIRDPDLIYPGQVFVLPEGGN